MLSGYSDTAKERQYHVGNKQKKGVEMSVSKVCSNVQKRVVCSQRQDSRSLKTRLKKSLFNTRIEQRDSSVVRPRVSRVSHYGDLVILRKNFKND